MYVYNFVLGLNFLFFAFAGYVYDDGFETEETKI